MWKCLDHKNIVPLLGNITDHLQLISEWMPGGHLTEYIGNHPDANRLGLVSVPPPTFVPVLTPAQVCDIAEGLYYLHSRNIVHGNIKGVRN